MDYKSIDGTPAEIAERHGHKDILDLLRAPKKQIECLTDRCRQQPPRLSVDRFMKLEHQPCSPRQAPVAVPELGR